MWKIYSASKESMCLQTTFARLRDVLPEDVYRGVVSYISYDWDKIPAGNTFWPLTYKRGSFEHERELRAVWSNMAAVSSAGPAVAGGLEYRPAPQECVWKHVDLGALIENVFVSPAAKPWFLELLKKVLGRYGLSVPVHQSDLAAAPSTNGFSSSGVVSYNCYMKVSISEAKYRFPDMLGRIAIGEEVVLTDKGEPVAKLVPIPATAKKRRKIRLGSAKGEFTVPDDFNDPLPKEIEDLFW